MPSIFKRNLRPSSTPIANDIVNESKSSINCLYGSVITHHWRYWMQSIYKVRAHSFCVLKKQNRKNRLWFTVHKRPIMKPNVAVICNKIRSSSNNLKISSDTNTIPIGNSSKVDILSECDRTNSTCYDSFFFFLRPRFMFI